MATGKAGGNRLSEGPPHSTPLKRNNGSPEGNPKRTQNHALNSAESLELRLSSRGEWDALLDHYAEQLSQPNLNAQARAELLLHRGQALLAGPGELEQARADFEEAVTLQPRFWAVYPKLRQVYARLGRFELVVQSGELEAKAPLGAAAAAALHFDLGDAWLHHLGDPEEAFHHYRATLLRDPQHRQALDGCFAAASLISNPTTLLSQWAELSDQLEGEAKARCLVALATGEDPSLTSEIAANRLETAFALSENHPDILAARLQSAEARNEWERALELRISRFHRESDEEIKASEAKKIAAICQHHTHNLEESIRWYERAFSCAPESEETLNTLIEHYSNDGERKLELLIKYRSALETRGTFAPPQWMLQEAQLYSATGDHQQARRCLEQLLVRTPRFDPALEELDRLLESNNESAARIEVLKQRALDDHHPAAQRARWYQTLGRLYHEQLAMPTEARNAWMQADQLQPDFANCSAIAALCQEMDDEASFSTWLKSALRRGSPPLRADRLARFASLQNTDSAISEVALAALDEAFALVSSAPRALKVLRAFAATQLSDPRVFQRFCRQALACESSNDRGAMALQIAEHLIQSGEKDQAIPWLERVVQIDSNQKVALKELIQIHEANGDFEQAIPYLERLIGIDPSAQNAAMLRKLGHWLFEAQHYDAAVRSLRAALRSDPNDWDSRERLSNAFEATGELEAASQILEANIEDVPDERLERNLVRIEQLRLRALGDVDTTLQVLKRLSPRSLCAQNRFETLLEKEERYEALLEHLREKRLCAESSGDAALQIDLERVRILSDHLSRHAEAIALLRTTRRLHPSCAQLRDWNEKLARLTNDDVALLASLTEAANQQQNPSLRAVIDFERATLLANSFEQPNAAYDILRTYFEQPSNNLTQRALSLAHEILQHANQPDLLRSFLEWKLERSDEESRHEIHEQLATLCELELADLEAALSHRKTLCQLAPDNQHFLAAAELSRKCSDINSLAELLEAQLEYNENPTDRISIHDQLANLYLGQLENPQKARAHFERILSLNPAHIDAVEFFSQEFRDSGCYEEQLELLQRCLCHMENDEEKAANLRVRIANLLVERKSESQTAVDLLQRSLSEAHFHMPSAEYLAQLFTQIDDDTGLITLAQRALKHAKNPREAFQWQRRLGEAWLRLQEGSRALEALQAAAALIPDDPEIESLLISTSRQYGNPSNLIALLEEQLQHCSGSEESRIRLELAELLTQDENNKERAIDHLRRILEINPNHAGALEQGLRVAEASNNFQAELEFLQHALRRPTSLNERLPWLLRRAHLFAGPLKQTEEAIRCFRECLDCDPSCLPALFGLQELLAAVGDYEACLEVLSQEFSVLAPNFQAQAAARGAEIAWQHLGSEAALPWLESLRRMRPKDRQVREKLTQIYSSLGRKDAQVLCLAECAALTESKQARKELHNQRAQLLEEIGAPTSSVIDALESAHTEEENDLTILKHLARLYHQAGRHQEELLILEKQIALVPDQEVQLLHEEIAHLHFDKLNNAEKASQHFKTALEIAKQLKLSRAESLRGLSNCFKKLGRIPEWAQYAEQELAGLSPSLEATLARRKALLAELARAYSGPIANADKAIHYLEMLLDCDSNTQSAEYGFAEEELLQRLRRSGDNEKLAKRLQAWLNRNPAQTSAWIELARICQYQLHDPTAAISAYEASLRNEPGHRGALDALLLLHEQLGDMASCIPVLEALLTHYPEDAPSQRAVRWRQLGRIHWSALHDASSARSALLEALQLESTDLETLRMLQDIDLTLENFEAALEHYRQELEVLENHDRGRSQILHLQIGELLKDRCNDFVAAKTAFQAAEKLGDLSDEQALTLIELCSRCEDRRGFVHYLEPFARQKPRAIGESLHRDLVNTYIQQGNHTAAHRAAERALLAGFTSNALWQLTAELRQQSGDGEGAAQALAKVAGRSHGWEAAEQYRLAAQSTNDSNHALRYLLEARNHAPQHAGVELALAELYCQNEAWQDALAAAKCAHRILSSIEAKPIEEISEAASMGALAAQHLGAHEEAADLYASAAAHSSETWKLLRAEAENRLACGDVATVYSQLRQQVEQVDELAQQLELRALFGQSCLRSERYEEALEAFQRILEQSPDSLVAHRGRVTALEALSRPRAMAQALEAWAQYCNSPEELARYEIRAAELECREGGLTQDIELRLLRALESTPDDARGWQLLLNAWIEADRENEAIQLAHEWMPRIQNKQAQAVLGMLYAKAQENVGNVEDALESYAAVIHENGPQAKGAFESRLHLLRREGLWRAAAKQLESSIRHGATPWITSDYFLQWGQIAAGPLESIETAMHIYAEGLERFPKDTRLSSALGQVYALRPEHWDKALQLQQQILMKDPGNEIALRALLRIAEGRRSQKAVADGNKILQAIGAESASQTTGGLHLRFSQALRFQNNTAEGLRRIAQLAKHEIAAALGNSANLQPVPNESAMANYRNACLIAEAELSCAGLLPLSNDEVGEVLRTLVALANDATSVDSKGQLVNRMSEQLGRRTKRRIQRELSRWGLDKDKDSLLEDFDFRAWRQELRIMARLAAMDTCNGDLTTALNAIQSGQELSHDNQHEEPGEYKQFLKRVIAGYLHYFSG